MTLTPIEYDEIREGDRILVTPHKQAPRFAMVVDSIYYEEYGQPRFAVAGYQVRVGDPSSRFTNRRVFRRRQGMRALKIEKVTL